MIIGEKELDFQNTCILPFRNILLLIITHTSYIYSYINVFIGLYKLYIVKSHIYLYIQDRKREYADENGIMKGKRLFEV